MSDGGAAAAAAAAIAQAIKASGVIVRVEPDEFVKLLARQSEPLIVCAVGGFLSTRAEVFLVRGIPCLRQEWPRSRNVSGN